MSKPSYIAHVMIASAVIIASQIFRIPTLQINALTKQNLGYPKDSLLNFTELTQKYGYLSEEHTVVTEDGYLLRLFRIVQGKNCVGRKRTPPVILMHGLLQSSDAWLDAGPRAGLAYLLADACHDLWVGNKRGNYYSRRHKHLDPDTDPEFWKFSVDDIGFYDIPATIDYVLEYTGVEKVNYIGFSQGSGAFFIMCSDRPEYCKKVQLLIGLAPASRQTNTKSAIYRAITTSLDRLSSLLAKVGLEEVLSKGAFSQEFMAFLCHFRMMSNGFCGTLVAMFDSNHPGSIADETTRMLYGHFPAGTSLRNMARYGQSMRSQNFEKYNHGKDMNMKFYGSEYPPVYNLSAVTLPVVVIYGRNDHLVDPKDVEWLVTRLPEVLESVEVSDPLWNHMDVTYSRYTRSLLLPKINEYLLKYSYT